MAKTQYVIEGGLVTKVQLTETAAVPLEDMLEELVTRTPLHLGHVPKNLKAISVEDDEGGGLHAKLVIGHDPHKRTISYIDETAYYNGGDAKQWNIQLPFGMFWIHMRGTKTWGLQGQEFVWAANGWGYLWSNVPYNGFKTPAWKPDFPNIMDGSRICFGTVRQENGQSLGQYVDGSINGFWSSNFNRDMQWFFPNDMNFETWQEEGDDWMKWSTWEKDHQELGEWFNGYDANFNWQQPQPMNGGEAIPDVPLIPTFDNLETWLDGLNETQRDRLKYAFENRTD
jgi:hypothetical protein